MMFTLRAELREVKTGEKNYLMLKGSYFDRVLDSDVPVRLSVMVDDRDVHRLPELKNLIGTLVEIPVRALVSKEKKRLFYVTNY